LPGRVPEQSAALVTLRKYDVAGAKLRIGLLARAFSTDGTRITRNLDFDAAVIG
jgi:hypothetical protein